VEKGIPGPISVVGMIGNVCQDSMPEPIVPTKS
jgi:hypothetical protein